MFIDVEFCFERDTKRTRWESCFYLEFLKRQIGVMLRSKERDRFSHRKTLNSKSNKIMLKILRKKTQIDLTISDLIL